MTTSVVVTDSVELSVGPFGQSAIGPVGGRRSVCVCVLRCAGTI